jgi:hypothetical protein
MSGEMDLSTINDLLAEVDVLEMDLKNVIDLSVEELGLITRYQRLVKFRLLVASKNWDIAIKLLQVL